MTTFTLQCLEEITGRLKIFKLFMNNRCEYDEFEMQIETEGSYSTELITIQTRLQEISEGKLLPKEKFRNITQKKELVKEYEIKTRHLRVYLFHENQTGRIIVCGGKKTTQKKDLNHFRRIKKEYINRQN